MSATMRLWICRTIWSFRSQAERGGGIGWAVVPRSTSSTHTASAGGVTLRPSWCRRTCARSEEHTSELQSLRHLVCRLLLEKKQENCVWQLFSDVEAESAKPDHGLATL